MNDYLNADHISPTFCILPWIHFATYTNGDVSTCCMASPMRDINLNNCSIEKIWNSSHFKETRLKMLQGEQLDRCILCYQQEKNNIPSHRVEENQIGFSRLSHAGINELIIQTNKDGSLPIKPSTIDLRPSNRCNLKCIMCGPTESTQWKDDALFLAQNLRTDARLTWKFNVKAAQSKFDWFSKPHIRDEIVNLLPSIKHIIFGGGEPLLLKNHDLFIREAIKSGLSQNIELRYHTNGTQITREHIKQWQNFKHVQIMLSIDGTENVNNYIRFPSKWSHLLKVLSLLDETPDNIEPQILSTMSLLNFPYIIDFSDWLSQQQYKKIGKESHHGFFHPAILFWPKYLSITALPAEVKKQLTKSIKQYAQYTNNLQINRLINITDYMNSCDNSHLLPQTREFLGKIDQMRNTNYTLLFSYLDL